MDYWLHTASQFYTKNNGTKKEPIYHYASFNTTVQNLIAKVIFIAISGNVLLDFFKSKILITTNFLFHFILIA